MAGLVPIFTAAQSARLRKLGVHAAQMEKLRIVVALSRLWLNKPAAKNDVAELLDEVAELSRQLAQRLCALVAQRDAAHASAHAHIEAAYWPKRPTDDGPTSAHHLCPRLDALCAAARGAKSSLPPGPVRYRAADYKPIERIDMALRDGWRSIHGPGVRTSDMPGPIPPAYPHELKPSATEGSAFREICGICYEVAGRGVDADPLRAIRAYLRRCGSERQAAILEIEKAIKVVGDREKLTKNRTSRRT
jgi:hypothetical protein